MSWLSLIRPGQRSGADDNTLIGVTDIVMAVLAGEVVAWTASRAGAIGLSSFKLEPDGDVTRFDHAVFPGDVMVGQEPALFALDLGEGAELAATGVNREGLWTYDVGTDGALSAQGDSPGSAPLPDDLLGVVQLSIGTNAYLFGYRQGQSQLDRWEINGGQLADPIAFTTGTTSAIVALRAVDIGSVRFLVAAAHGDDALLVWRLDADGNPTLADRIAIQDGLGIAGPSSLDVVQMHGRGYAVLASRESQSLSVFEIAADGRLRMTDHVLDTLGTRFAHVSRLAAVEMGGTVYLAAAGSDDGVSLFQLLPGGRLVHHLALVDTVTLGLSDISALALTEGTEGLELVIASETKPGLSRFTLHATLPEHQVFGTAANASLSGGEASDILTGGAGSERLIGAGGADILRDGAGSDTLTGGPGADLFLFDSDGQRDEITDFELGIDRIDLSGWAFLRNPTQLAARSIGAGVELAFGNEVLRVFSTTQNLTIDAVLNSGLIGLDRLLPDWFDTVQTALDRAQGGPGDDTLMGGMTQDRLDGGGGNDHILAAGGDDTIVGGTGADQMNGGPGSDIYYVDDSGDIVLESYRWEGHDVVNASVSFRLSRTHVEDLLLDGAAIVGAGNGLANRIIGSAGDNVLDGGRGVDTLVGGHGNDVYLIRSPGDIADETTGSGMDTVKAFRSYKLGEGLERLYLQSLFTRDGHAVQGINGLGNALDNVVIGNPFDNRIAGLEGRDTLKGQAGADVFMFVRPASHANMDRIIDFNANTPNEGDTLLFAASAYPGLEPGALPDDALHYGALPADAQDRFIFDTASGILWFDPDGIGPASAMPVALFEQGARPDANDFLIV